MSDRSLGWLGKLSLALMLTAGTACDDASGSGSAAISDAGLDSGMANGGLDAGGMMDASSERDATPGCPQGRTRCGDACVDTSRDDTHCGRCDNACTPAAMCNGVGVCDEVCAPGSGLCQGQCIDAQNDAKHCGATPACGDEPGGSAGAVCGALEMCAAGQCVCAPHLVRCGGACIDPLTDNLHCGAQLGCGEGDAASAGSACEAGLVCNGLGRCRSDCATGWIACDGRCVRPDRDLEFCGASAACTGGIAGASCPDDQVCSAGVCGSTCASRETLCLGRCTDVTRDRSHCGGCSTQGGTVCSPNQACIDGQCKLSPPVAVDDVGAVIEGGEVTLEVLENDTDPDGNLAPETVEVVTAPSHGSVDLLTNGRVAYHHRGDEAPSDSFTYRVADTLDAKSEPVRVTIAVTPVNDPPVALDDATTVREGDTTDFDVLANDVDPDDGFDLASLEVLDLPQHATLSVLSNGKVRYAHDGSETHSDAFSYRVADASGVLTDKAVMHVAITPVNDLPVAQGDVASLDEGDAVSIDVLANDTDVDSVLSTAGITLQDAPLHGSVRVVAQGIEYTHDGSENTADSLSYVVIDPQGGRSAPAVVSLTIRPVNDAPVAGNDAAHVDEGGTSVILFAANDADPEGELVLSSVRVVTPPAHGDIAFADDGTVEYVHDGSESDEDAFSYTLADDDGLEAAPAVVTITVVAVNDRPVARADFASVAEGDEILIDVLDNDTDADDGLDPSSVRIVTAALHGHLTVENGTIRYEHDGDEVGSDDFTYVVSDLAGAAAAAATVTVEVTPVNDRPAFTSAPLTTAVDDAAYTYAIVTSDDDGGDTLTIRAETLPSWLQLSNAGGGTATLSGTPDDSVLGVHPVVLRVTDSAGAFAQQSFTIQVANAEDAPSFTSTPPLHAEQDELYEYVVTGTDPDPGDTLVFSLQTTPAWLKLEITVDRGAVLSGTPTNNDVGSHQVQLLVTDTTGISVTQDFMVTVANVNDAPRLSPIPAQSTLEDVPLTGLELKPTDQDPGTTTLTLRARSSNQALVPDANLVIAQTSARWFLTATPLPDANGVTTVTVTVDDGLLQHEQSFVLTVTAVPDRPRIGSLSDRATPEDTPLVVAWSVSDVDSPIESLIVQASAANTSLFPAGSVVVSGSGVNRTLTLTPAANASGSSQVTVSVSDEGDPTVRLFHVTVNAVNDPPTVNSIPNQRLNEDTTTAPLAFTVGDIESGPVPLLTSVVSDNATLLPAGSMVLAGSGASRTLTITPAPDQNGEATLTLSVSDGQATTETQLRVVVDPVVDPPTIANVGAQQTQEDVPIGPVAIAIADPDVDASTLQLTVSSNNQTLLPSANLVLGGSGGARTLNITPATNRSGVGTLTLRVSDGTLEASVSFSVTVTAVNDPPSVSPIAQKTTQEDVAFAPIVFVVDDVESGASPLVVSVESDQQSLVPNGNLVASGSGANRSLAMTPVANQNGSATIRVRVSDGEDTTTVAFTAVVLAVNDTPTISSIADQSTDEDVAIGPLPFTIADLETANSALQVRVESDAAGLLPSAGFSLGGSGSNRTLTIQSGANLSGSGHITVTVSDGQLGDSTTFAVQVRPVNDPPTLEPLPDATTDEDVALGPLSFAVSDVETTLASLTVTATSSNSSLVPNGTLTLGGSGAARTLTVTPTANASGVTTITVSVSDGVATVNSPFQLTVRAVNDVPTITAIANQTLVESTSGAALALTIGDVETALSALVVTASSSNQTVIPNGAITLSGSGASRTVQVTSGETTGQTVVTLSVSDGDANQTTSFTVRVVDTRPPRLSESTPVPTPTTDNTPNVSFSSSEGGQLTVGGGCSSATAAVGAGETTLTLGPLTDGVYAACTLTVTDAASNASTPLSVTSFKVDTAAPAPGNAGVIASSAITPNELTLTWTRATDALSSQSALQYQVFRSSSNNLSSVAAIQANGVPQSAFRTNASSLRMTGLSASSTYFFNVLVRDEVGNVAGYATVQVTTDAPDGSTNREPTARARTERGHTFGVANFASGIVLGASESFDPDGTPLTYAWNVQTAPAGSTASFSAPTSATPSFVPDRAGIYVLKLTVSDGLDQASDTVTVSSFGLAAGSGGSGADEGTGCAVNGSGQVLCWGWGAYGQMGDGGSAAENATPQPVTGIADAIQVDVGDSHACAVRASGKVSCWGYNDFGALGNNSTVSSATPVDVAGVSNAVQVAAGGDVEATSAFGCALLGDRTVRCWGRGDDGEMGNGTTTVANRSPVSVSAISTAVQITADQTSACALLSNGTVRCWGWNGFGQLGTGNFTASSTPVAVSGLNGVVQIASQTHGHCALKADSTVHCWGYNGHGEVGDSSITNRNVPTAVVSVNTAVSISGHAGGFCAVTSDGRVSCWGDGSNGQLGSGTTASINASPVQVTSLSNALQVFGGARKNCALLDRNALQCWGNNGNGALGNGSTTDSATPVQLLSFP